MGKFNFPVDEKLRIMAKMQPEGGSLRAELELYADEFVALTSQRDELLAACRTLMETGEQVDRQLSYMTECDACANDPTEVWPDTDCDGCAECSAREDSHNFCLAVLQARAAIAATGQGEVGA